MSCGGDSCEEAGEAVAGLLAALVLLCLARNALALAVCCCFPPRRVRSSGGGGRGLSGRAPRRILLEGAPSSQGAGRPRSALKRPSSLGRGTGAAAPPGKPSQQQRRPVSPSEGGRGAKPSAPGPHRRAPRSPDRGGGGEEEAGAGAAVLLRWLGAPVTVLEGGRAAAEEATGKKRPPPKAPRGAELVLMAAAAEEKGFRAPGPLLLLRARSPPDPASAGKVVFDAEWVHCGVGGPETPRGAPSSNPRDGRTARFGQ